MGIWTFFFDHDRWSQLYEYNCSMKTQAEWAAAGHANIPLGMLYATIGTICELVYIPFMLAMLKPEFIQYSCYKLMFLISIVDLFVLPCNAIITGIQCAFGWHFCTNPTFFFFVGAIGTSGFYGVSFTCIILAIDRLFEMCFPEIAVKIFGGFRIYFWLVLPIFYILFSFSHTVFMFNNKRYVYFSDPYVEIENMKGNPEFSKLVFHCIHNVICAFALVIIYSSIIIILKIKTMLYENVTITKVQKLMTLQSLCICIEMFFAALVYVYNQFLPLPNIIEIIANVSWIGIHGDTPIVYLLLNASLRKAVFKMLRSFKKRIFTKMSKVSTLNAHTSKSSVIPDVQQYIK